MQMGVKCGKLKSESLKNECFSTPVDTQERANRSMINALEVRLVIQGSN